MRLSCASSMSASRTGTRLIPSASLISSWSTLVPGRSFPVRICSRRYAAAVSFRLGWLIARARVPPSNMSVSAKASSPVDRQHDRDLFDDAFRVGAVAELFVEEPLELRTTGPFVGERGHARLQQVADLGLHTIAAPRVQLSRLELVVAVRADRVPQP